MTRLDRRQFLEALLVSVVASKVTLPVGFSEEVFVYAANTEKTTYTWFWTSYIVMVNGEGILELSDREDVQI